MEGQRSVMEGRDGAEVPRRELVEPCGVRPTLGGTCVLTSPSAESVHEGEALLP